MPKQVHRNEKTNPLIRCTICLFLALTYHWMHPMAYGQFDSAEIKQILILGDSHLNGEFGELLQKKIHGIGMYDILSIAIGGAGSLHFTIPLKNFCCGYKIRESCHFEYFGPYSTCRVIESQNILTNQLIGKGYQGKLSNFLIAYKPAYIIICLGSNNINAHQELVNMIRKYLPDTKIIWVGPFRRKMLNERLIPILKIIEKNQNMYFIPSHDVVGNDTLSSTHFSGKTAIKWASKITERLDTLLH